MSAFIEVRVIGDRRALIEAGSIAGIITSQDSRLDTIATAEKPLAIILRGGETVQVYGESGAMVIARATQIRAEVRELGLDIKADLLDAHMYEGDDASPAPG